MDPGPGGGGDGGGISVPITWTEKSPGALLGLSEEGIGFPSSVPGVRSINDRPANAVRNAGGALGQPPTTTPPKQFGPLRGGWGWGQPGRGGRVPQRPSLKMTPSSH